MLANVFVPNFRKFNRSKVLKQLQIQQKDQIKRDHQGNSPLQLQVKNLNDDRNYLSNSKDTQKLQNIIVKDQLSTPPRNCLQLKKNFNTNRNKNLAKLFSLDKQKIFTILKSPSKSRSPTSIQINYISPKRNRKLNSIELASTKQTLSIQRPPSLLNHGCDYINKSQIMFQSNLQHNFEKNQQIKAYWMTKCCYVRLIRIQGSEQYLQQGEHIGMVKIYGRIKIKFFQYLVTQNFQGFTLQNILQQYGPCSQRFIKKSIKTLLKGLQIIHIKGHVFNILSPNKIFVNLKGDIAIDTTKAKSTGRLTMQQKKNDFYFISPQLLINGQNGFINDTWSIGAVTLAMIFGQKITQNIQLHPYNKLEKYIQNWKNRRGHQLPQKILKLKKQYFFEKTNYNNGRNIFKNQQKTIGLNQLRKQKQKNKIQIQLQISDQLENFLESCLKFQERHQVGQLLKHPFLKD